MKNKNLVESFNNALNGIIYTVKNERNIKIHICIAAIVLVLSVIIKLSRVEFLIVCITIGFVMACELFNTAVEVIVDIIVDVYHPKAKIVKDVAAGAVLLSSFVSIIVGYIIFYDKLNQLVGMSIRLIKTTKIDITIITAIITISIILIIKAKLKRGTPFSGGMPSGHSALAACITTSVALWSEDRNITILCGVLSLLVIQSRLEGKIHTVLELAVGAFAGFLISVILFQIFR